MAVRGPAPARPSYLRIAVQLALIVAIAFGLHFLVDWLLDQTSRLPPGSAKAVRISLLGGIILVYALMIAVPFVPGIEIGISLILMYGADIAGFVYIATVAGLLLAFQAGRWVPMPVLGRIFLDLRLIRAADFVSQIEALGAERRLTLLRRALPRSLGHLVVNYRYLLLALLINMPGSALIGGGGGICLLAGLTGLFRTRVTVLTIALAVLPFPLIMWFWGPGMLS